MSGDGPTPGPMDPVLGDDELLDALRRGTPPPPDDPVAALLAGWHTEIEARAARLEAKPWPTPATPTVPSEPDGGARRRADLSAGPGERTDPDASRGGPAGPRGHVDGPAGADGGAGGPDGRTDHRLGSRRMRPGAGTPRRRARLLSGAALTLVTMTGGVWLGSARAEPDGLLWPVTELVWTERAESLTAEREIDWLLDQARRDLGAGRYAQARADLDRAGALLAHLGGDRRADRLRTDLDDLRNRLPAPARPASPAPILPDAPSAPPTEPPAGDAGASAPAAVLPSALPPSADAPPPAPPGPPDHPSPTTSPAAAAPALDTGQPAAPTARPPTGRPANAPDGPAGRPTDVPAPTGRPSGAPTEIPAPSGRPSAGSPPDPPEATRRPNDSPTRPGTEDGNSPGSRRRTGW